MSDANLVQNIKQLWNADGRILDLTARRLGVRIVIFSFAVLIASVSILAAALGIYIALSDLFGWSVAALILSVVSIFLAALLFAGAAKGPYAAQLENAEHDHAEAVEALKSEIQRFDIFNPGQNTPLVETILPLIAPLVSALIVEGLKRRRESDATETSPTAKPEAQS